MAKRQKKEKTYNRWQNTTQKTKVRATRTQLKTWDAPKCKEILAPLFDPFMLFLLKIR